MLMQAMMISRLARVLSSVQCSPNIPSLVPRPIPSFSMLHAWGRGYNISLETSVTLKRALSPVQWTPNLLIAPLSPRDREESSILTVVFVLTENSTVYSLRVSQIIPTNKSF